MLILPFGMSLGLKAAYAQGIALCLQKIKLEVEIQEYDNCRKILARKR
jgi:hypothetical protein